MDFVEITFEPLSIESISDTICGTNDYFYAAIEHTKDDYKGERITSTFTNYESLANAFLIQMCIDIRRLHPEVENIAIYYRVACVKGANLLVALTSLEEASLFETLAWIIEEIKRKLPLYNTTAHHMVQINAPAEEIDRRVEKFIEKTSNQVKERNNMSFFANESPEKTEFFCSRVDAKYKKRCYSKGYLQVNEVDLADRSFSSSSNDSQDDVFKRLKSAEDRLLRLEKIEPTRYATFWNDRVYVDKGSYKHRKWSVDYVDQVLSEIKDRKARLGTCTDNT